MTPPPAKVFADALVMVIVEVLGVTVRFVAVAVFHAVAPLPDIAQVLEPMLIALVLVLLELKNAVVTVKFAASNVPCVSVNVLAAPNVIASASVTVIPEPLTVTLLSDLPALAIVPEARNVGENVA